MNSELSYIHSQTHGQELLQAAQHEHRFDAAASRSRKPRRSETTLKVRVGHPWRALALRRAAMGKA
jgi:hypothetical protein